MSDTKLRDLERRWKETGTVEDEAAYLLERVRVGDLTQERLELAAYCGHAAAARATGFGVVESGLEEWTFGLGRWGKWPCVEGALALARWALDSSPRRDDKRVTDALSAASTWLMCPCDIHAKRARVAASEVQRAASFDRSSRPLLLAVSYAVRTAAVDPTPSARCASLVVRELRPMFSDDEIRTPIVERLGERALSDGSPYERASRAVSEPTDDWERLGRYIGIQSVLERLGDDGTAPFDLDLDDWIRGFAAFGFETSVQVAIACVEAMSDRLPQATAEHVRSTLEAVKAAVGEIPCADLEVQLAGALAEPSPNASCWQDAGRPRRVSALLAKSVLARDVEGTIAAASEAITMDGAFRAAVTARLGAWWSRSRRSAPREHR